MLGDAFQIYLSISALFIYTSSHTKQRYDSQNMYETSVQWLNERPVWSENSYKYLEANPFNTVETLENVLNVSETHPIKFPIDSIRCKTLKKECGSEKLEQYINSVYPVLHERALPLFVEFIQHKQRFGSKLEKELFENCTVVKLVDRLLKKRAVSFLGRNDMYLLLDGTDGTGKWDDLQETKSDQYISYDEIKLSALLSVSSETYFINDGNRGNCGVPLNDRDCIQDDGIIVGLIGTRLEKMNVMEHQEVVICATQNKAGNGYGVTFAPTLEGVFSNYYGKPAWTYDMFLREKDVDTTERFKKLSEFVYFDNEAFAKRVLLSVDTLLIEANDRAKRAGKSAFVHVVGLGLGVWRISSHQVQVFLDACAERLKKSGENLPYVSDVYFAYFSNATKCGPFNNGEKIEIKGHANGGITVHLGNREPHHKLMGNNRDKLLVVSYAWDGNALPGNEFWLGSLDGSGDPAAASSTQVAELHNPHINRLVCGENLHIATPEGIVKFSEYSAKVLAKSK